MKIITINSEKHGTKEAFVDDEDYEYLNQHKWFISKKTLKNSHTFYAITTLRIKNQKQKTVRMHRLIMKASTEMVIDHKDHNGLNNQKENLRKASDSENQCNRIATSKSGFKGVYLDKRWKSWKAEIKKDKKHYYLGCFKTAEEAARAYDAKAKELHGEFANLNFK